MEPLSKEDLKNEVVIALIEHYRAADPKVRIASLHGAIFVLRWQAAERLSGEALAKIATESIPRLKEEIDRSGEQLQAATENDAWTALERLIAAAERGDGCTEEDRQIALDAAIAQARVVLADKPMPK